MDIMDIMMAKAISGGSGGGGGGGTGAGDVFVVPVTATLDSGGAATYNTNVSAADVASAVADSVPVLYALTTDAENMITQSTSYAVASVPGFAVVVMFNSATDSFRPIVLYHTADGISDQEPGGI